jgi:hypothetical protein
MFGLCIARLDGVWSILVVECPIRCAVRVLMEVHAVCGRGKVNDAALNIVVWRCTVPVDKHLESATKAPQNV